MAEEPKATSTAERRRETRWPTDEAAVLVRLNPGEVVEAQMVDVSSAGLRVRLRDPLAAGEPVRVEFRGKVWFGDVRWLRRLEADLFEAGVAISVHAGAR
jgi:hypothetical protein